MFKELINTRKFKPSYKIRREPTGRRIAIGDIHGCATTFKSLLFGKINLLKEDQLFLLGDYIDRGPKSLETIDLILELINLDYKVFPLMGNHEANLLEAWNDFQSLRNKAGKDFSTWIQSTDLLNKDKSLKSRVENLIAVLPYYYELDQFILVHAGLNFEMENPFEDFESMIRTRKTLGINNTGKTIIHGHVVTKLNQINKLLKNRSNTIGIDNGCVYKKEKNEKEIGHLIGLNLDSFELYLQENIE